MSDDELAWTPERRRTGRARPPWSEFRAALDEQGFRPSKALGQNFLLDANMAASIARDAGVGPGDYVLEVGPGCGFLSVHLAALGCELAALEIDARLARVARRFLAPFPNVRLEVGDALARKHALSPELLGLLPPPGREWAVVANLPYSIAAPLLAELARLEHPPARLCVLVQDEVAERLAAPAATAAYGALTVKLDRLYEVRLGRPVPAGLFWPRPRVESRVVHLARRPGAQALPVAWEALVDGLFQHRRKTLRAALRGLAGRGPGSPARVEAALAAAGLEGGLRPEALAPPALERLARAWEAGSEAPGPGSGPPGGPGGLGGPRGGGGDPAGGGSGGGTGGGTGGAREGRRGRGRACSPSPGGSSGPGLFS